jgi:hypothetical protein
MFPRFFRAQVMAVLSMALWTPDGKRPRHPEALFWVLPKELILHILELLWELHQRPLLNSISQ